MKRVLAAVAILVASHVAASAEENEFFGGFEITAIAGTCPNGTSVGQRALARYLPRNTANSRPHSDFNLYSEQFAEGYRLLNKAVTSAFQKVQYTSVGSGSGSIPLAESVSFIRFTTQPANITAATLSVFLVGQIKGYNGDQPNCTVTFRFSGVKR